MTAALLWCGRLRRFDNGPRVWIFPVAEEEGLTQQCRDLVVLSFGSPDWAAQAELHVARRRLGSVTFQGVYAADGQTASWLVRSSAWLRRRFTT